MQVEKKGVQEELKITGNWEDSAKQLKKRHSNLSVEDLKFEPGKENELLSRIGSRLGKNKTEIVSMIKDIQSAKN